MGDLFGPVGPAGNFHHNAVLTHHEDDGTLGAGYVAAGDALVEHWVEHGPNDLLFMPIIMNYRHGIELLLKNAIRTAARCLRRDGSTDPELRDPELSKWLAHEVRHKLQPLAERLDQLLGRLREETLPPDIHKTLIRVHELDPTGETFRYATSWSKEDKRFVPSNRPDATHVDVVAMGAEFHSVANLIEGGVGTVLDLYREYQSEYENEWI
jgi:hypothetical protein